MRERDSKAMATIRHKRITFPTVMGDASAIVVLVKCCEVEFKANGTARPFTACKSCGRKFAWDGTETEQ